MNNNDILVVSHSDLDGITSYLVLCWALGKKLPVKFTTPRTLVADYENICKRETWKKIFFLDLDVSAIGEDIDKPTTVIFDHHKTNIYQFKTATAKVQDDTSCAKLLYNSFWKENSKLAPLSQGRKTLIALADDQDSGNNKISLSKELNIVYHSMTNKLVSFVEEYYDGFKPFDKFQQNTITLYEKHCREYIEALNLYRGEVTFAGQNDVKVVAVFCDKFVQECCDYILSATDADVAIAVLVDKQRIVVRRHPNNTTLDVSAFTQRIASGGGHAAAAGGSLTEDFMDFTKLLKPFWAQTK